MPPAKRPQVGRILLIVIGVLAALFLAYQFLWVPLETYNNQVISLSREIEEKQADVNDIRKSKPLLERWRQESLPADQYLARREYEQYLDKLMQRSKVTVDVLQPNITGGEARTAPGGKKLVYVPLDFNIDARATLPALTEMLRRFKDTPLEHKIKTLKVEPADTHGSKAKKGELKVHLVVEAIVIEGADRAQPNLLGVNGRLIELDVLNTLYRGPAWLNLLAQAVPVRNYADIAHRDVFAGPEPPQVVRKKTAGEDIRQYIVLTKITQDDKNAEAVLLDRYNNNRKMVLHAAPGSNTFPIRDSEGAAKEKVEVFKIASRDIYFRIGEKGIFGLHIGENLAQARRLEMREARELGLKLPGKAHTPKKKKRSLR